MTVVIGEVVQTLLFGTRVLIVQRVNQIQIVRDKPVSSISNVIWDISWC